MLPREIFGSTGPVIIRQTVQPSRFRRGYLDSLGNPESRPICDWERKNPDFDSRQIFIKEDEMQNT